jgi:hypothetical protein
MCIVVDINTLSAVFSEDCDLHSEFCYVKNWINEGKGYVVFGGTKYKDELARTKKYLRLIRLLKDAGKAISISDAAVDTLEAEVISKTTGTTCDDQHVIALLGASKCYLLCSLDSRSYAFVKQRTLYPPGMPKVKIYASSRNRVLLRPLDPRILRNVG